ncbi:MFS transporter [Streptomyces sp. NPDC004284]|uniref:MFS transporter n=1 Tax=Streptomyces sp. NPDC004284 TaxID=3364695 RepID=UPI0036A9A121
MATAPATGAFWAVGFAIVTAAAGPARSTRAVGVMMGGLTLANVVGVPIGSFVGRYTGWRGPFWALAALAGLAAVFVRRFIPRTERRAGISVRAEVRALRQGRLWLVLAAAVLVMGGVLATYTYLTPLLTDRAGVPAGAVPLVLIASGQAPSRLRANLVRFAPGARIHWHTHTVGQTLHVVSGVASIGTRDGTVLEAHPGETVSCPPGEEHWHGAARDRVMEHIAIREATTDDTPETTWADPVTDTQCNSPAYATTERSRARKGNTTWTE